jgi:phosphate-selective porin OprO/OprP
MNTKHIKQLVLAAATGAQFTLPALAADNAATGTNGTAQVEIPAFAADGSSGSSSDAVEIKLLKQQLQVLIEKVNALEQQQHAAPAQQTATIQDLDQQVKILARQRELDQEAAAALAKTQPKLSVGPGGLTASSADTNFVFSLKGLVQVDSRTFFDDSAIRSNDGFLLRRARPIFQGTLYRDFDFVFVPDFGGSSVQIFDAYGNYRYEPWLQLRAGKFKTPEGLEQLQADVYTSFNERSLVTDLVPNRDVGLQLWGDINGGVLSYAAGVFNGVGDARNSSNAAFENNVEFAARLFAQPFKNTDIAALQNLGVGVAGTVEHDSGTVNALPGTTGGTLPGYTTDGQQQFFAYNPAGGVVLANGKHWRLSPQGYYYYGPFGLLGEYAISDQEVSKGAAKADLHNTAWQISGGWVLTGENASFNGVTPLHPFNPHTSQWGALQVVARYAELNIDDDAFPVFSNPDTSASAAKAWSVGLNWYLNKNIRVNTSYSHTTFTGGGGVGVAAPATVTRQPEDVLFTRIQLAF